MNNIKFDADGKIISDIKLDTAGKTRLDAVAGDGAGLFFEKELESIDGRIYEVLERELMYAEDIPVNASIVSEGAQEYTFRMLDGVGMAKLIEDYSADIPTSEVLGEEASYRVHPYASGYRYSEQEIRAARMAGKPLEAMKADRARRAMNEKHNSLAYVGDSKVSKTGLLNNPNIAVNAVVNGAGASPLWSEKTGQEIYNDVVTSMNAIIENSDNKIKPDTLRLPVAQYSLIKSKIFNADGGNFATVLEMIENLGIDVKPRKEMKNAFTSGTEDGFILYEKNPEYLEFLIAMPTRSYPPERDNLTWKIALESRVVGTIIRYPIAFDIRTGI